jgi:DNA-binding FadR family transcriptional regulator
MTYRQVRRSTVSNNLTDRIASMLRVDIVSGKYETGGQLPAGKDMSATFGVSITVIREALLRLKSDVSRCRLPGWPRSGAGPAT